MTKQSCSTCRFAEFEMTEHERPRIKPNGYTTCTAPIDVSAVALPACVQVVPSLNSYLERSRHGVQPNGGENCPCYEAAEPLPTRSQMAEELTAAGWKYSEHWKCWTDPSAPVYSGGYGTVHTWRTMKKAQTAQAQ